MLKRIFLPLLAVALLLPACGTFNVSVEQNLPPAGSTPTRDTLEIEATSMSAFITQQAATLIALTPTITPNPPYDPSRPWKTYQDDTFGFVMEYPAIYDEPPYAESCGLKLSNQVVRVGRQTEVLFLVSNNLTLDEYAAKLVQDKGWVPESQRSETVSGLPALTVDYRFGGTSRFGTFTLVDFQGLIFAFGFTAGDFCDIPGTVTEAEAYSHLVQTFHIRGAQPPPTATPTASPAPQVSPILVYPPDESRSALLLGGTRDGNWVGAGTTAAFLAGGESYAIYQEGRLLTTAQGSSPHQRPPSCPAMQQVSLESAAPLASAVALSASWNPLPRRPLEISPDNETYRQAVFEDLRLNGIREPDVRLTRVLKVDLEGDGTDEIIISASRFADASGRDAAAGDHSIVLLRKVSGSSVSSIPLAGAYYYRPQASVFPPRYLLTDVLDLNGDGRMEIVLSVGGKDQLGAMAFEINGAAPRLVLTVRCPE